MIKRIKLFITALALSLSSVFALAVPQALAASITWDGSESSDVTDGDNWVGGSAPTGSDVAVFPSNASELDIEVPSAVSWAGIEFSGAATSASSYTFTGVGSITVGTGGIANSMTGSGAKFQNINVDIVLGGTQTWSTTSADIGFGADINLDTYALTVDVAEDYRIAHGGSGVISGTTGTITKIGAGDLLFSSTSPNTFAGAVTVSAGRVVVKDGTSLGNTAGGTTIASGATAYFYGTEDTTIAEPITMGGVGAGAGGAALAIGQNYGLGGGGGSDDLPLATFSGVITLTADTVVSAGRNGKVTGAISGNFTISLKNTSQGTFELASSDNGSKTANGVLSIAPYETTYDEDSSGTNISVKVYETAIVTGKYGDVTVAYTGTLKGTGTVGAVAVNGTIAPGLSPGCLNTGNLTLFGSYAFELGGTTACTGYDQIVVTGTVDAGGTLNVSRYDNFVPKAGQKYVIINNDGSDAISNTFGGLAEGATFDADGVTFSISYVGGDGNDVELTVTAVSPDTGFALLTNNPFATVAVMLGAAGGIALLARRQFGFAARKR